MSLVMIQIFEFSPIMAREKKQNKTKQTNKQTNKQSL